MPCELVDIVARQTAARGGPGAHATAIDGLTMIRADRARRPDHMIVRPALCVVVQGAKWTMFGLQRFHYGPGQALVVGVEMPALGSITEATPARPFLGLVIELDPGIVREVAEELDHAPGPDGAGGGALVTTLDGPLADCMLRLMRLLDDPKAIPALAPLILREICYRLRTGPDGEAVLRIMLATGRSRRIAGAIHRLRERFAEPFRVGELAAIARLSPSAFHR